MFKGLFEEPPLLETTAASTTTMTKPAAMAPLVRLDRPPDLAREARVRSAETAHESVAALAA
jgi:hypothetical protein